MHHVHLQTVLKHWLHRVSEREHPGKEVETIFFQLTNIFKRSSNDFPPFFSSCSVGLQDSSPHKASPQTVEGSELGD